MPDSFKNRRGETLSDAELEQRSLASRKHGLRGNDWRDIEDYLEGQLSLEGQSMIKKTASPKEEASVSSKPGLTGAVLS